MPSTVTCHGVPSGQALTAFLFADGSDTEIASGDFTFATNRKGTGTFSANVTGLHKIELRTAGGVLFWFGFATLATSGSIEASDSRDLVVIGGNASLGAANTTDIPALIEDVSGKRFKAKALETAPTGSGGGIGTGARQVTFTINDGTDPLENAIVRVIQGAENYSATTDVDGEIVFALDDATWSYAVTKPGYQGVTGSLIVNGAEALTVSLTAVTITPSEPSQTTGYLTVRTIAGAAAAGVSVVLQITDFAAGDTGDGIDIPLATGITDASGYVEFVGLPRLAKYLVRIGNASGSKAGVTADAATTPLVNVFGEIIV